jgi:hypothetical protein
MCKASAGIAEKRAYFHFSNVLIIALGHINFYLIAVEAVFWAGTYFSVLLWLSVNKILQWCLINNLNRII